MSEDPLIVIAIDFGTSYSGYAVQTLKDFKTDPLKIHVANWYYGDSTLVTNKTNTSILFKPDKTFHSFGYDAESNYFSLCSNSLADYEDADFHDWYFFRKFKMQLYREDPAAINAAMEIKDFNGKRMKAIEVISSALRFLKDKALIKITSTRTNTFREDDVKWVVTVPAIWTDSAKEFVRSACEKAGIKKQKLALALEPEVAAIFCKEYLTHTEEEDDSSSLVPFDTGCSFMVLDLGGGTADITVHHIGKDNKLEEIHKATGGDCGGENADEEFIKMWIKIVGKAKYKDLMKEFPDELLDLRTSFQSIKRQITKSKHSYVLSLPQCIKDVSDLPQKIEAFCGKDVSLTRGKAKISRTCIEKMFDLPISNLIEHLKSLQDTVLNKVDYILLVGGFADSVLVKEKIKTEFPFKTFIDPTECNLAVLKGAAMFGFDPSCISRRISRYTYGVSCSKPFVEDKDPEIHKHFVDGEARCEDLFDVFIRSGEMIYPGQTKVTRTCRTISTGDKAVIDIYCTRDSSPMFVIGTEEETARCKKMGSLQIDLSNDVDRERKNRLFQVTMFFTYSNINVKVVDMKTNQEKNAILNLLK